VTGVQTCALPILMVGFAPSAIAVNSLTNKVYVANTYSNTVTVIDAADSNTTTTVDVGSYPFDVVLNQTTNKIYVANQGDGSHSSTVTVIDAANNNSTSTVGVGVYPSAIAVNPDTNKVYVVNTNSNNITVIDAANSNTTTSVAVGMFPFAVALNKTTNKVYVANQGNGSGSSIVTVIDGVSNSSSPVSIGTTPYAIAVNPITNKVYVANRGSDNVTVIDGVTNTPTTLAAAPADPTWDAPRSIAVNSLNNKVFVANELSNNVAVIQNFYTVTITKGGTGTGTVTSSRMRINCGTSCSAVFPESPAVILFQTPAPNSGFSGWGGVCSGTGDCAFSMLSDKAVSAVFVSEPLVKNQNTGVAYGILQDAYNEAKDNHVISARSTLTAPGLNLNKATTLTIEGGYNADYSSCIGLTTVLGRVNVRLAPLYVRGLSIKATP